MKLSRHLYSALACSALLACACAGNGSESEPAAGDAAAADGGSSLGNGGAAADGGSAGSGGSGARTGSASGSGASRADSGGSGARTGSASGSGASRAGTGGAAGGGRAGASGAAASAGGTSGAAAGAGGAGDSSTPTLPGWKLVWSDEFDGAKGAKLDASRWVYETGGSGWGNNQLEYDTDRAENASLDGAGELAITAFKENYMGKSYTSVRLKTQGKFEHKYGRYEARMRLPFGQGMWPAFWMLGTDPDNVGWPARGEIDIMENIGREPNTIHGTLHGPGYSGTNGVGAASKLAMSKRFADDYHVFAIEWEENAIRWYVDGTLYQTRTPSDLPKGSKWVYDHPFFLLLNLAVGGQWPGNPDATTTFPQTMKVDYVRVYDRE